MNKGDVVQVVILRKTNSGRYICPVPHAVSKRNISIDTEIIKDSGYSPGDEIVVKLGHRSGPDYFEVETICDKDSDADYSVAGFGRGAYNKKYKIVEANANSNQNEVKNDQENSKTKSDVSSSAIQKNSNNNEQTNGSENSDKKPETTIDDEKLELLRKRAEEASVGEVDKNATTNPQAANQYDRSQEIREYVKARAEGYCEGCDKPAPFTSKTGKPYLHAHHVEELSKGGSDTPETVIALCPNCHYRVHHGEDGQEYNEKLKLRIAEIED